MATVVGTDYTKRKKTHLEVVIGTEDSPRKLLVLPPTADTHKEIIRMAEVVEKALNGEIDDGVDLQECLATVAKFLSRNTQMESVTPEYLNETGFDITDIGDFIGLYIMFVTKLVEGKN